MANSERTDVRVVFVVFTRRATSHRTRGVGDARVLTPHLASDAAILERLLRPQAVLLQNLRGLVRRACCAGWVLTTLVVDYARLMCDIHHSTRFAHDCILAAQVGRRVTLDTG